MYKGHPGESNCKAKLTAPEVRAIRKSPSTHKDAAALYGVTVFTIWDIRARRSWKHIDDPTDVPSFETPNERWRPVVGSESKYEVSDKGNVRNRCADTNRPRHPIKIWPTSFGYRRACLYINGKQRDCFVHRLVMAAFVGPVQKGKQVNHKDGDKTNNRLENLEYVTCKENQQHASRMRLRAAGERHWNAKLTASEALTIYRSTETAQALAVRYGITRMQVYHIKWKQAWQQIHDAPSVPSI